MKRSVQYSLVYLSAIVFALSAACGQPSKPPKTIKTVVIISNTATNFWKIVQEGAEKADNGLADVNLVFKMASGSSVKDQERYINESLNRDDDDAIAISPIDPIEMKAILEKAANRVWLMTLDSDAPLSPRELYLGADNRAAGRQAGELVKQALPKGGKIMAFVGKRQENAMERLAGMREALQGSKVEILDLMLDNDDLTKAKENATEAMTKYPDLAGMVGLFSYNGPAILRAVQNAGKVGKIKIVAFDDEPDTLTGIKEGSIFGTVAQQPFEYGYQSVQLMARLLKNDKSVIPPDKKTYIPTVVVKRDNVDEYRHKMEQILAAKK